MNRALLCLVLVACGLAYAARAPAATIYWHFDPNSIDLDDLNNVRNNFGSLGVGDYTGDGRVDLDDLNYVRNRFGAPDLDPPSWVDPAQPTTNDVIRYYLDYGGGSNGCEATIYAGGAPYFTFDDVNRDVRIAFDANSIPDVCSDVDDPVRGLTGEFGPLSAGEWTLGIAGLPPFVEFQVHTGATVPEPSTIALFGAGALVSAMMNCRERSR